MKITIATTSQLKVRALENAVQKLGIEAEIISVKTDSKVSSQPFGYEETILGAKNRVAHAKTQESGDIIMAVESGLIEIDSKYFDIACVYTESLDDSSMTFSAGYYIPDWMIKEVQEKKTELGFITQRLSGDENKDPLNYLSGNRIKREEVLSEAIYLALVKLINKETYEIN